jgi:hypothetical protein
MGAGPTFDARSNASFEAHSHRAKSVTPVIVAHFALRILARRVQSGVRQNETSEYAAVCTVRVLLRS